jgi:hypothetical protein
MAQADSNNTTPAPVDSTRRRFMSQAASIAAGSAVLAVGATIPAPAQALQRLPDPILAAIEAHKAARIVVYSAVDAVSDREKQLKAEGKLRDKDDARLEECQTVLSRAFDAETDAAIALLSEPPATMAGVIALLQYAVAADTDGEGWPRELESDGRTRSRSWQFFLIEMLADVLPGMVSS